MKQSWELQRKELNDCRAEITSLKMHIEGYHSGRSMMANDVDPIQSQSVENYKEEIISLQMEIERLKSKCTKAPKSVDSNHNEDSLQIEEKVVEIDEDKTIISHPQDVAGVSVSEDVQSLIIDNTGKPEEASPDLSINHSNENITIENNQNDVKQNGELPLEDDGRRIELDNLNVEAASANVASSFSFSWKLDYFP